MSLLAHARIATWEGGALWMVDALAAPEMGRTEPHAHHAIQITFVLDGSMRFRAADLDVAARAVAIAPDVTHVFEARGIHAHLFIDPDSRNGRSITRSFLQQAPLVRVPFAAVQASVPPLLAQFRAPDRNDAALIGHGRSLTERLAGGVGGDAPDIRVRKLMRAAAERLDATISLSDFAGVGGLSASRLRHLFVEQTGLPFRTYVLWLRLSRAVDLIAAGLPLTRAAHEAGFADSAHFSRTFKRMFGVTPAALRIS